jgi:SAM-dependent methyltransferase
VLSFSDASFGAVLCNLGLMFFPGPLRGLSEICRVLRPGGRAAVSVNTVVERSYNHQINATIARYPLLALSRSVQLQNSGCFSMRLASLNLRPIRSDTRSCCRHSRPITVPSNAAALLQAGRWLHFLRKTPRYTRRGAARPR